MRWWLLALLAGCGSDPCASITEAAQIEVGGADAAGATFEPFSDGSERSLIAGPQGGYHVWLHARVRGICPASARIERRVIDEATGDLLLFSSSGAGLVETATEGEHELDGAVPMQLCPPVIVPPVGRALRFYARITDGSGRSAEAMRSFMAACPAGDLRCADVCSM